MAMIGNTVTQQAFTPAIDYFSGNGSTVAFTLSRPVASVAQVQAVIENVAQNPSTAFTVSGNTITFTSAPPSGSNNIYVYYTSPITQVVALPQSPSIIGDVNASGGVLAAGTFNSGYVDGTVLDYTSGTGRITVGGSDGFKIRNNGISSPVDLLAIDSSGNVGIGTSSPRATFDVIGTSVLADSDYGYGAIELGKYGTGDRYSYIDFHSSGTPGAIDLSARLIRNPGVNGLLVLSNTGAGAVQVIASGNGVSLSANATSWGAISDERLKTNLVEIQNAVQKITSLRAFTGRYKSDDVGTSRAFLIAQDVQAVLPEAVSVEDGEEGILSLRYTDTIPLLVKAIQEQQAIIASLTARIEALEAK